MNIDIAKSLGQGIYTKEEADVVALESTLTTSISSIEIAEDLGIQKTLPVNSRIGELVKTTAKVPFGDCVKANGSLLSRTEYADLWEFAQLSENIYTEDEWNKTQSLGYSYGDGSTTFRVPDWRGVFERAWDDDKGIDLNRKLGTYQEDLIKKHKHPQLPLSWRGIFASGSNRAGWYWNENGYSKPPEESFGGVETRPKNGSVLYCIKYK